MPGSSPGMTSVFACTPTSISDAPITHTHTFAFSRRDAPEFYKYFVPPRTEGAGNARRPMRLQPRVRG